MNPITTKLFAIPVAIASLIMAYACSTPERKETVSVTPVQEVTLDSTTTQPPAPTTTQAPLDLTGVDWKALALFIEEERRITRQMEVDEARMRYGRCGEWYNLAMAIGWPAEEWPIISKVLYRESRCNIDSWNKTDPASGSRGLMQINGSWCRPNKWNPHPAGWLGGLGILTSCEDLFNPEVNLRAGLAIWLYGENKHGCGWRGPWATPCA
jgi:hypothetical protein